VTRKGLPSVGSVHSFERVLTDDDMAIFGRLTGDQSPLHTDPDTARRLGFENALIYGLLAGSLISRLIGMWPLWENPLCLDQSFRYLLPLYPNETVTIRGTVLSASPALRMITLKTEVLRGNHLAIDGEAHVKLLGDIPQEPPQ
jgi:3-hydroxybutyryl-CoA dehydratase